jgi:hypothetical protein
MKTFGRWLSATLDCADYLLTLARLTVLDWPARPRKTAVDRAIREEGKRLRKAFPTIDFDHPGRRASRTVGEQ